MLIRIEVYELATADANNKTSRRNYIGHSEKRTIEQFDGYTANQSRVTSTDNFEPKYIPIY